MSKQKFDSENAGLLMVRKMSFIAMIVGIVGVLGSLAIANSQYGYGGSQRKLLSANFLEQWFTYGGSMNKTIFMFCIIAAILGLIIYVASNGSYKNKLNYYMKNHNNDSNITDNPKSSFCGKCGNKIDSESAFCNKCGDKVIT